MLFLLLVLLLVVVLDGVDLGPGELAAPVRECMLVCFMALLSEVFKTPFIFELVNYWPRLRRVWELFEEDVLENTQV